MADMHKSGCEKETCRKGSNENDLNFISSDTVADQYQVQYQVWCYLLAIQKYARNQTRRMKERIKQP